MSGASLQQKIIRDAVDAILRELSRVPSTPDVDGLLRMAGECLRQAERWAVVTPSREERERLMNRVLMLHAEVAALDRLDGNG